MERQEIAAKLESQIKLYRHLGLKVAKISSAEARFQASLQDHLNHKGTAFGGSLYAIGVLAAYSLVLANLQEAGIPTENIVIAKGEIEYFRPVEDDFEACCQFPSSIEQQNFIHQLRTHQKARQSLEVQISSKGKVCAVLRGLFVVKV